MGSGERLKRPGLIGLKQSKDGKNELSGFKFLIESSRVLQNCNTSIF